MTYDPNTEYTGCPVWKETLLEGYTRRRFTDPLWALVWFWTELYSRHPYARVKKHRWAVWGVLGRLEG